MSLRNFPCTYLKPELVGDFPGHSQGATFFDWADTRMTGRLSSCYFDHYSYPRSSLFVGLGSERSISMNSRL